MTTYIYMHIILQTRTAAATSPLSQDSINGGVDNNNNNNNNNYMGSRLGWYVDKF